MLSALLSSEEEKEPQSHQAYRHTDFLQVYFAPTR